MILLVPILQFPSVEPYSSPISAIPNRSTKFCHISGLSPFPYILRTLCCFSSGDGGCWNKYLQISPMYWATVTLYYENLYKFRIRPLKFLMNFRSMEWNLKRRNVNSHLDTIFPESGSRKLFTDHNGRSKIYGLSYSKHTTGRVV
jgi:hypothetical protein